MIGSLRLKVCGLATAEDAAAAAGIGADFLGFILYPKSPRYLPLARFAELRPRLPALPKVAVTVTPSTEELDAVLAAGFDFVQIHFPATDAAVARMASEHVGVARLWLAPKLPPETELDAALLPLAETWLLDAYRADSFGGTGHTGDWAKFRRYSEKYPAKRWVLAGGLSRENVAAAVAATGARMIDVNSGVESAPGRKDVAKLAALRAVLMR
jgi:phosphoribosylanthranilate isomerase